jgi:formylglycine-generating enzyme required for sulfatase activity
MQLTKRSKKQEKQKNKVKASRLVLGALCLAGIARAQQPQAFEAYTATIPESSVSFSMAAIPAGTFMMGSATSEKGRSDDEGPQRHVSISAFWMGTHEVTHDEFLLFMNDESISRNSDVDAVTRPTPQYIDFSLGMGKQGGFPVNSMSQHSAMMYCRWLYKKTGVFYRLPTEAEWEYACRAGSTTVYPFGSDSSQLKDYAWYAANSMDKYHKTGEKKPNAWGLYDMLGNVAEWTIDQFSEKYLVDIPDNAADPMTEPVSRYPKTLKGGAFNTPAIVTRPAARFRSELSWNRRDPQIPKSKWWLTDAAQVGFRLVRPAKQPSPEEAEAFYKKYLGN